MCACGSVSGSVRCEFWRQNGAIDLDGPWLDCIPESLRQMAENRRPPPASPDTVYFARCADGLIKIGCSSNVPVRLRHLAWQLGAPLELLHTEPGHLRREKELHRRFAGTQDHGEFFHASPALSDYIKHAAASEV